MVTYRAWDIAFISLVIRATGTDIENFLHRVCVLIVTVCPGLRRYTGRQAVGPRL